VFGLAPDSALFPNGYRVITKNRGVGRERLTPADTWGNGFVRANAAGDYWFFNDWFSPAAPNAVGKSAAQFAALIPEWLPDSIELLHCF